MNIITLLVAPCEAVLIASAFESSAAPQATLQPRGNLRVEEGPQEPRPAPASLLIGLILCSHLMRR